MEWRMPARKTTRGMQNRNTCPKCNQHGSSRLRSVKTLINSNNKDQQPPTDYDDVTTNTNRDNNCVLETLKLITKSLIVITFLDN